MALPSETRPWGEMWTIFHPQLTPGLIPNQKDMLVSVKLLRLEPNQKTSLQYHSSRAEFLIIAGGQGQIAMPDDESPGDLAVHHVVPGQIVIIRRNERHRLIAGDKGLEILEVWHKRVGPEPLGRLEESDITRLADDYGRVK